MKILTLSTYPTLVPRHGGQHRLVNIVRLLREAGHKVTSVGVLGSELYEAQPGFVPYPDPGHFKKYISSYSLMDDWALGQLFAKDNTFYHSLASQITDIPDVIHVEQPWLFEFAVRYRSESASKHLKIIYGSQNIENFLKFDILKIYMGVSDAKLNQQLVLACELYALENADTVICVSDHDRRWCNSRTKVPTVLAQNGVRDSVYELGGLVEASKIAGNKKSALFCASAHPPNIAGFFDIFGNGLGCLSPDDQIVIAGSASDSIFNDARFAKTPGLSAACVGAGVVSEACLSGLLHNAHVIILPITQGGGTNLKTAEALWAGRHVVATEKAMRGFEHFGGFKGVSVQATPQGFCEALRDAMASKPITLTSIEKDQRRSVLWEETLQQYVENLAQWEAD